MTACGTAGSPHDAPVSVPFGATMPLTEMADRPIPTHVRPYIPFSTPGPVPLDPVGPRVRRER